MRRSARRHSNVHAFPSSIDVPHFAQARVVQADPSDQAGIPYPRVGFFGVLDERFDSALVSEVAALRPDVHFVFLGPVVKIDPAQLPTASNIHYLGSKSYAELPRYLAGWDAAILPFAMNDSTRFISPTKTPEYLAAGKRVVSSPIKDVVTDYGISGLVEIAGTAAEFATALDRALTADHDADWTRACRVEAGPILLGSHMGCNARRNRRGPQIARTRTPARFGVALQPQFLECVRRALRLPRRRCGLCRIRRSREVGIAAWKASFDHRQAPAHRG